MTEPKITTPSGSSRTSESAASALGTFGLLLGAASTVAALIISGYWAMGLGAVGLPLSFAARSKMRASAGGPTGLATTAVTLNIIGLALGLAAQLMKLYAMSRGR